MAEPGVHVEFMQYPMLHALNSQAAGRPVYVDKPHVRIKVAGQDKDDHFGPVNEQIKARFPQEWEAFQRGCELPVTGTPIEQWPQMTVTSVANLKTLNIRTVEDVATLADSALTKIGPGAVKLRADAQKYLSSAQLSADLAQMDELRETNAAQAAQIKQQGDALAALQAQMADLIQRVPQAAPQGVAAPATEPAPATKKRTKATAE